jgi:hypothetical protein
MVPALLFGTPIVEIRAMALLGVVLAVPVAISRVARSQEAQSASRPERAVARVTPPFKPPGSYTARRQPAMKPEV